MWTANYEILFISNLTLEVIVVFVDFLLVWTPWWRIQTLCAIATASTTYPIWYNFEWNCRIIILANRIIRWLWQNYWKWDFLAYGYVSVLGTTTTRAPKVRSSHMTKSDLGGTGIINHHFLQAQIRPIFWLTVDSELIALNRRIARVVSQILIHHCWWRYFQIPPHQTTKAIK